MNYPLQYKPYRFSSKAIIEQNHANFINFQSRSRASTLGYYMDIFLTLLAKIAPFFIYIAIGYVIGRFVNLDVKRLTWQVLSLIIAPFIFVVLLQAPIDGEAFMLVPIVMTLILMMVFLSRVIGFFVYPDKPHMASLLSLSTAWGNNGMFGIPVVGTLFGTEYIAIWALMILSNSVTYHTVGYAIGAAGNKGDDHFIKRLKIMVVALAKFPVFWGMVLGIVANVFVTDMLTDNAQQNLDMMSDILKQAATLGGMGIIGLLASRYHLRISTRFLASVFLLRYCLWPLLATCFIFFNNTVFHFLPRDLAFLIAIFSLMPSAIMVSSYAVIHDLDEGQAVMIIFINTLLSLCFLSLLSVFVT